jgi:hypothetical protein
MIVTVDKQGACVCTRSWVQRFRVQRLMINRKAELKKAILIFGKTFLPPRQQNINLG